MSTREDILSPGEIADLHTYCGADAAKWAEQFRLTAIRLGYSDMDEGWLIGWFANAIERAEQVRHPYAAAPTPPAAEAHPDDLAVDRFAAIMKAKLAVARDKGRGGWEDREKCPDGYLSQLLREHVEKGDPVDIANLAMMLSLRGERIAPPAPSAPWKPYLPGINASAADANASAPVPLAWRYRYNGQWYVCDNEAFARNGRDVTPLYPAPTPPDELGKAFDRLLEAADKFNGVYSCQDRVAGRFQGDMILAVHRIRRLQRSPAPKGET